jgi:hypothetical protein
MGEWRYSSIILDLGFTWRTMVSFMPLSLYPHGKSSTGTYWIGGYVGLGAGLDAVEMRKISHYLESNPSHPARRYTD